MRVFLLLAAIAACHVGTAKEMGVTLNGYVYYTFQQHTYMLYATVNVMHIKRLKHVYEWFQFGLNDTS